MTIKILFNRFLSCNRPLNFYSPHVLKNRLLFVLLFSCLGTLRLFAQTDTIINGKHYTVVDDKKADGTLKKRKTPLDSTFVIKNKRMKYYNNWISGGAGLQQNLTYKRKPGFTVGLDYNFHIQHQYFQLGTFITGEKFGFYDNYQFHLGYGKRYEDKDVHGAAFVGISYSTGYGKVDSTGIYEIPFKHPGVYFEGQLVKKIAYDVGIGVGLFADWNEQQALLGARFLIYFSGAYKGKKFEKG